MEAAISSVSYFLTGTIVKLGKIQRSKYQWAFVVSESFSAVIARDVPDFFAEYNDDVLDYLESKNRLVHVALPQPSNCNYPQEL